ncbi:peptide/nickel transport system substrate-binding protein [Dethiosulfatibacter aminovorans DSM 17477]|uniref:Peptide/nickel transport system substrate-binding protein n=1 Tax=Dethiosulfatibacter aminovorans DSM 17477 TaxID=1121476 RepID=A0A1M6BLG0_9FIRM|nr:ABC transporter substrate-binding protein [Dethiosulfatibacter aminovorans]SHI49559.1 peptide/nickel transport system substrate-binding protein [Dethiosulfatibacter aminovorans DSM 17477]
MTNKRKFLSLLLVLILCLSAFTGCSQPTEEPAQEPAEEPSDQTPAEEPDSNEPVAEEDKFGGVLNIALASAPKNLDPIKYTGVYEGQVIRSVADTLVAYKQDLSGIAPNLATEWSASEDGLVYTFKLRDDVYFQKGEYQDGKHFTAADVKYALERSANESAMNRLGMLDHVEIINDYEVELYLNEPSSAFLTVLTDAGNVIVPQEEVEGWGDSFGSHLVGTGPFALKEFKMDQEVILEKNENYWAADPYLDGLVYKIITDSNQMTNALRTGEIDVATDLTGESVQIVRDDADLVIQELPGLHVAYMYMNLMHGPTADIKVREAIIRAVDIDEMVKGIYQFDEAQRAYLPLPPGSWGYDASLESIVPSYNPELAKQLLEEAGYPDGFSLEIYVSNKPARVKMCTILQAYLKQNLNIDLEIKTAEWGTFSEIASSGQADMYGMSWTWYPDPFFFLNKMFHSSEIGALGNGQGFNNPEVDRLLDEALKVTDTEERAALYKEALKLITENYSRINYSNEKVIYGFNPAVQDFMMRADNQIVVCSPEINVWMK